MKKYILPIVLGAGAIFYFLIKNKDKNTPVNIEQQDETKAATFTTKPKKKAPDKKTLDVNKAINNLSKLKSSKGGQIVQKVVKKKLAKKKSKITPTNFVTPSQLKKPVPFV
jgi:hypothetical protein